MVLRPQTAHTPITLAIEPIARARAPYARPMMLAVAISSSSSASDTRPETL